MILLELAVIALGALVMAAGVHVAARGAVLTRRRAPVLRRAPAKPATLAGLEMLVGGALGVADVQLRLRPVLREIAAARLARHGVRLELDDDRARELLGDELWEIVRPGRSLPEDRFGPGLSRGELRGLLERLEAL